MIYRVLPRAPVCSSTALGEDGGDATSFSLEDAGKVIFLLLRAGTVQRALCQWKGHEPEIFLPHLQAAE